MEPSYDTSDNQQQDYLKRSVSFWVIKGEFLAPLVSELRLIARQQDISLLFWCLLFFEVVQHMVSYHTVPFLILAAKVYSSFFAKLFQVTLTKQQYKIALSNTDLIPTVF